MRINMEIITVIRNGIDARNMAVKGTSLYKPCRVNANIAKGGLIEPAIIAATHNTPNCRGLKPSAVTMGKNTGNVIISTANISVTHPAII